MSDNRVFTIELSESFISEMEKHYLKDNEVPQDGWHERMIVDAIGKDLEFGKSVDELNNVLAKLKQPLQEIEANTSKILEHEQIIASKHNGGKVVIQDTPIHTTDIAGKKLKPTNTLKSGGTIDPRAQKLLDDMKAKSNKVQHPNKSYIDQSKILGQPYSG